jgi:hypothetical protein
MQYDSVQHKLFHNLHAYVTGYLNQINNIDLQNTFPMSLLGIVWWEYCQQALLQIDMLESSGFLSLPTQC